jgi:hypothetical protein
MFENRKPIKQLGSEEEETTGREGMYGRDFAVCVHKILLTNELSN